MTASATARSSRAPLFIGAGLLVSLILIGLVAGSGDSPQGGPPYSPSSTDGDGTRGLVLLVRELGADVRVGQRTPDTDARRALLLHDGLDDPGRSALEAWVAAGGTLVVADPGSALAAPPADFSVTGGRRGFCNIPELEDVQELDVSLGADLRVGQSMQSCFGDGGFAFIVSKLVGAGHIITIGGPDVFTNDVLDHADNSALAARLLLPGEGGSVAILDPNPPGSGRTTLGDLIADRVFQAILQIGIAFLVYAVWRSRRIGRPVTEPQPVAIAGSQFVRAVGGLQQRSHSTDRAATALRVDTRRMLSDRFGVPLTLDTATLAELTASRTRLDRTQVAAALSDAPILDEASLVTLGQQLDTIRQEVLDGRRR